MKNAAGKDAGVQGVKISNAHKTASAPKTVAPSTKRAANNNLSSGGGGGGGGGSKPKKPTRAKEAEPVEKKVYEEEVDRYYEITNAIEDLTAEMTRLSKVKDSVWGYDKLRIIDEELKTIDDEIDLLKEKKRIAEEFLKFDTNKAIELGFEIDMDTHRISNYPERIAAATKQYNTDMEALRVRENNNNIAEASLADMEDGDEKYAKEFEIEDEADAIAKEREEVEKTYRDILDIAQSYNETIDEINGVIEDIYDTELRKQELAAEQIILPVELKAELDDQALETLDSRIERMKDNFFKSAEAMNLIFKQAQRINKELNLEEITLNPLRRKTPTELQRSLETEDPNDDSRYTSERYE
jgi:hypothetical protein